MKIRYALLLLIFPIVAFAHGGHKHVMGTVASITPTALTVHTSAGDKSVPLTASTQFFRGSSTKEKAAAADVSEGMRVVVHLDGEGNAIEVHIPDKK